MCISVEAKAIQALCNDLDTLNKEAAQVNAAIARLHSEFYGAAVKLSNKHLTILAKMSAVQDAVSQLQYKNTYNQLYPTP